MSHGVAVVERALELGVNYFDTAPLYGRGRSEEVLGVALSFDEPIAFVEGLADKIPGARPSMLLDHMAGRQGEVDVINGAIPKAAQGTGVPTPINDTVVALVRARERDMGVRDA